MTGRLMLQFLCTYGLYGFLKYRFHFSQHDILYQQKYLQYKPKCTIAFYFSQGFSKLLNIITRFSYFPFSITKEMNFPKIQFLAGVFTKINFFFILYSSCTATKSKNAAEMWHIETAFSLNLMVV
jgi:hypothetical protein